MQGFTNPVLPRGDDPWIIYEKGVYYYCFSKDGSIFITATDVFYKLDRKPTKCVWTPPPNTEYSKELWAPELHFIDGFWYIYVACDNGENANHRMYVLRCDKPQGDYKFMGKITDPTDKWAIDGTVMHLNNQMYFVWSGWEGDVDVCQNLYIAKMSDPLTIEGERYLISTPELSFELNGGNPLINEGPVALENDGNMFLVYSASGSWCDDYCLCYLTYKGGDPLLKSSWEKSSTPLLQKSESVFGTGHCSFFPAFNKTFVTYHANDIKGSGWGGRTLRMQEVLFKNDKPYIGKPKKSGEFIEL